MNVENSSELVEKPDTKSLKKKSSLRNKKKKRSHHIKPKSKPKKTYCGKFINICCRSGKQKGFDQRLYWLAEEMQEDQRKNEKMVRKTSYYWGKLRAHVQ